MGIYRIAFAQYGPPQTLPGIQLPPKGPPGPKGKRLRDSVESAMARLAAGDIPGGVDILKKAVEDYDANEP